MKGFVCTSLFKIRLLTNGLQLRKRSRQVKVTQRGEIPVPVYSTKKSNMCQRSNSITKTCKDNSCRSNRLVEIKENVTIEQPAKKCRKDNWTSDHLKLVEDANIERPAKRIKKDECTSEHVTVAKEDDGLTTKVSVPVDEGKSIGLELESHASKKGTLILPIDYEGEKATAYVTSRQSICFDGSAMVTVLQGRASMLGYTLNCGAKILVCSNSNHCAALTFEVHSVQYHVNAHVKDQFQVDVDESRNVELNMMNQRLEGQSDSDASPCILQFQSYNMEQEDHHEIGSNAAGQTFSLEIMEVGGLSRSSYNNSSFCKEGYKERRGDEDIADEKNAVVATDLTSRKRKLENDDMQSRKKLHNSSGRVLIPTHIPSTWWKTTESLLRESYFTPPIVAICGAKGTGKSTFGKFLVNQLLDRFGAVGYLDTDVGQPEFTIPGCVSFHVLTSPVFGSPMLHLRIPERCFYFGDISPQDNPEFYLHGIVELYDYYRHHFYPLNPQEDDTSKRIPLVINTHGWIRGIGYDVLVDLLSYARPTHVISMTSDKTSDNLPYGQFWDKTGSSTTVTLHIESVVTSKDSLVKPVKKNASDLRSSRILAYFGGRLVLHPRKERHVYKEVARVFVHSIPYEVSIEDVSIIQLQSVSIQDGSIIQLQSQVEQSKDLESINARLVGLGICSKDSLFMEPDKKPPPPACVGFGIVRGVDLLKGILYIITPLPLETLEQVNTILHGKIEIPIPLLQVDGYTCPYLSQNSLLVEGTGSGVMCRD